MKKFFTLLCVAMIALGINAAPQIKGLRTFEAPVAKQLNKTQLRKSVHSIANLAKAPVAIKHAPAQVNDLAVEVTIDSLTATSVKIITTPDDNTTVYYWDIMSADEYSAAESGAFAQYGINDLVDYGSYMLEYYVEQYGAAVLSQLCVTGVDSYTYSGLDPETEYVVVVWTVNLTTGICTDVVATESFTTLEPEPVEEFIGLIEVPEEDVTSTSAYVAIAPETSSPYYWDIMPLAMYDSIVAGLYAEYEIESLCDYVIGSISYYIDMYAMFGMELGFSDFLKVGDYEQQISNLSPSTEYIVFALSVDPYTEECVGEPATYTFTTPEIVASRQVTLNIAGGMLRDATATEYGAFIFVAEDAEYFAQGYVMSDAVAGDYTLDDLYAEYSFIGYGEDTYYIPLTADIHVTVSGSTATITGTMLCQNEDNDEIVEFTLNITCNIEEYEEPQGLQYDAEDEDYVGVFSEYELDKTYLAQYGSIMLAIVTDTTQVAIDFNLIGGAEDPVIGIPAGVYTIDDTYNPGTVTASAGVENNSVYPSFVAHVTNDGYLAVPLWFLEEGTVTVTNVNGQLHVEVDALNSYGREIKMTISGTAPEAIESAAAKTVATKALMNNQIVLIKNGKKFNLLGAKL